MRLTLVSPFDPSPPAGGDATDRVGGVERVFAQASRALARRGHDVTLLCSTSGSMPTNLVEDGVDVVRIPRRGIFLKAPVASLARNLTPDADLIHVAATYPFTTPGVLRRAHDLGIPSVLDFHFEPASGTAAGRFAANVYRQIGPRDYPLAAITLVRSLAYGRSSHSLDNVPRDRWRVVPNGIDPKRFTPAGPARAGGYLLFVGRLVRYKGVDVLLSALALLRPNVPLYIAGDGPLRGHLQAKARQLGVDARFLGHVPDDDLPALYRGALLTVLPSVTCQEAFGIALLESMACGTPVVASRLPGVTELAALGGLVSPPGDAKALANRLRTALWDDRLPRGSRLAKAIHDVYSWDAVAARLDEVYREVLDRPLPKALQAA